MRGRFAEEYRRFEQRLAANLAYVEANQTEAHKITAEKDWEKAFRSRPGSADYKPHCSCGWESSKFYYDDEQALAGGAYHLRRVKSS